MSFPRLSNLRRLVRTTHAPYCVLFRVRRARATEQERPNAEKYRHRCQSAFASTSSSIFSAPIHHQPINHRVPRLLSSPSIIYDPFFSFVDWVSPAMAKTSPKTSKGVSKSPQQSNASGTFLMAAFHSRLCYLRLLSFVFRLSSRIRLCVATGPTSLATDDVAIRVKILPNLLLDDSDDFNCFGRHRVL